MAGGWRFTKLSLSSALLLSFSGMRFVLISLSFCRFCFVFVFVFKLSLKLCRCLSDIFSSSIKEGLYPRLDGRPTGGSVHGWCKVCF